MIFCNQLTIYTTPVNSQSNELRFSTFTIVLNKTSVCSDHLGMCTSVCLCIFTGIMQTACSPNGYLVLAYISHLAFNVQLQLTKTVWMLLKIAVKNVQFSISIDRMKHCWQYVQNLYLFSCDTLFSCSHNL